MGSPKFLKTECQPKIVHTTPYQALTLGAPGISIQIDFSENVGSELIAQVSAQVHEAQMLTLPVLGMVNNFERLELGHILDCLTLLSEIGVVIIKIPSISVALNERSVADLSKRIRSFSPIVLAGGDSNSGSLQDIIDQVEMYGFMGLCVGRYIIQLQDRTNELQNIRNLIKANLNK